MCKRYGYIFVILFALLFCAACSSPKDRGETPAENETQESASESAEKEAEDTDAPAANAEDGAGTEQEAEEAGEAESADPSAEGQPENADAEETPESEDAISATVPEPLPGYESIVFVGDSRTLTMAYGGTYEFGLVPDDSVEATWGGVLTDNSAFENARLAARKHREKAVFWYGINDVQLNPNRNDPAVFINNYLKVLDAYLTIQPDSTIYIVSILNTTVREKDYYPGQEENIRKYNDALYRLCLERGWYYIDVTPLLTGDECFYEGDNIHFSRDWYQTRFLPYVTVFTGLNIYQE